MSIEKHGMSNKANQLKYTTECLFNIVNQLIEKAEKTKNIKQLRMLIFIQENNVNIFKVNMNYSHNWIALLCNPFIHNFRKI